MIEPQTSPNLMTSTALSRLVMTPAERAQGRFMRAPDGHGGGDPPADPPAADPPADSAEKPSDSADPPADAPADPAKDEPADKSLINGGGKEGEGDDPDPATLPPEKYSLTAPEGFEINDEILAEADPIFRDLGLTDEQANKLMPLAGSFANRLVSAQQDAFQAQATDWAKQAKADPEIGGKNWSETESLVAKALDRFAGPKVDDKGQPNTFRVLLDETKLGNHPEMIRMFRRIGAATSEDGELPRSDTGAPVKQPREAVLYPHDVPQKEGAN